MVFFQYLRPSLKRKGQKYKKKENNLKNKRSESVNGIVSDPTEESAKNGETNENVEITDEDSEVGGKIS